MSSAAEKARKAALIQDECITLRREVREYRQAIAVSRVRVSTLEAEVAKLDIIIAAFVHVALTPEDKKQ